MTTMWPTNPIGRLGVVLAALTVFGAITRGPAQNVPDGVRPRPSGPLAPDSCRQCHADIVRHDTIHGPVVVNACMACHRVVDVKQHTYALARTGADLCTFCHDIETTGMAVVHQPLRDGDCTVCHDPHGGPDARLLKAPTVDGLCQQCHDGVAEGAHVHGPVAVGACSVCHVPHASNEPGLLRQSNPGLCTDCHVTTGTQLSTMRSVHQPAAENCSICHDPHASDQPMMLRDEPSRLCLGCHENIRHTVETASTQHAAVTTDRQCLNCHDPHASDHAGVLRANTRTLCFECHDREIKLPGGGTLANIKAVIESGTSLHGPVATDDCGACHMIHGGDHFRLLVKEYPPEFYSPFAEENYALCFSCHDKQLVVDERTTALTDFRNGDLNLHYVHVNQDRKGRTCRACHETHASTHEKHIRTSVPFGTGGWQLPIGFEKTASGGSCAPGCHKPFGYDRMNAVAYPLPKPGVNLRPPARTDPPETPR